MYFTKTINRLIHSLKANHFRKDREKVIARQEFVDELSLWNDTQDAKTSILLPSKKLFSASQICSNLNQAGKVQNVQGDD